MNPSYAYIHKLGQAVSARRPTLVERRRPMQRSLIELVLRVDADAQLLDAPSHHVVVAIMRGLVKPGTK